MPICHMQLVRTQAAVLGRERAARALTKRPAAVLPGPHARGGGAPRLKVGVVAHVARRLRPAAQRRQASGSTLPRTRAPPPTPDRGARTCRISPVHVRRQTLHGSSASPIFVTVYEASQTGIARRSVRASSTSAAHTRMQACDRSGCASSQSTGGTSSADARVGEWTGRHVPCPCRRRVAARDARYAGADARSPTVALVHAEDVGVSVGGRLDSPLSLHQARH